MNNDLSILSFNILAETWFSNNHYDLEIIPDLNKYFPICHRNRSSNRIKTVKSYLNTLIKANSYDIICLQETEDFFNEYLIRTYSDHYQIFAVYHDYSFWLDEIDKNLPFYPNGLTTMIKKTKFSTINQIDIKLDIGNHGILSKCIDSNGNKFNIFNLHLDDEDESNINQYLNYNKLGRGRYVELSSVIRYLNMNYADYNLIIGDLNDGLNGYATHKFLTNNKFVDLFKITDNLSNTYPYILTKNEDEYKSIPYKIIDKIFIKTKKKFVCSKTTIYNKYNKIINNLLKTGSDHYAIDAIIQY